MAEGSAGRKLRDYATLFNVGTLVGLTDGELLRRVGLASPDEARALFEAIVDRHGPSVLAACRSALGDPADADDAFQATFLVLARRLRDARRLESVGGWLHGVAARVSARSRVDAARRRRHERARAALAVVAADAPPGEVDRERDRALRDEVARLPARYREVVVLCYWQGLTHEQAAARLACPLGTVRSRAARARELLRRRLLRRGLAPEGAAPDAQPAPTVVPAALARLTATAAAETFAGRTVLGPVGPAAVTLSHHSLRRMTMLKIAHLAAASALALVAAVGLGRAAWQEGPGAGPDGTAKAAAATPPRQATPSDYIVEPPDILLVEVLEALEGRPISGERLVRPDGKITLGFYGEVAAAGLTLPEIKEKVALHLRKYLSDEKLGLVVMDPETGRSRTVAPRDSDRIFVDVTAYNSKKYYLLGMFRSPDSFVCTGKDTILDAIMYAGGLLPGADVKHLVLVHDDRNGDPARNPKRTIDLDRIISGGDPSLNVLIQPGDRLIAPRLRDPSAPDQAPADGPTWPLPAAPRPEVSREDFDALRGRVERMEALLEKMGQKLGD